MQNSGHWPLDFDGERVVLDALVETDGNSVTPREHFLSVTLAGKFLIRRAPVPVDGMTYPVEIRGRLVYILVAQAKGHLLSLRIV